MKKVMIITLILLGALFVPAVSADELYNEIYNETFAFSSDSYVGVKSKEGGSYTSSVTANAIIFSDAMRSLDIRTLVVQGPTANFNNLPTDPVWWPVSFTDRYGNVVGSGTYSYFPYKVGDIDYSQISVDIDDIDLSNPNIHGVKLSAAPSGYSYIKIRHYGTSGQYFFPDVFSLMNTDTSGYVCFLTDAQLTPTKQTADTHMHRDIVYTTVYSQKWQNQIVIDDEGAGTVFRINRDLPGNTYSTVSILTSNGLTLNSGNTSANGEFRLMKDLYPLDVTIDPIISSSYHRIISLGDDPADPDDPTALMRTGTVTMTDNNGTTISGFEVTAVNAYTGQSYTVTTDTDVAVITLPMDRTISMRNPQTGEYEDTVIGYYRFYGQSPGYKMLYEDGIQVAVMPEKYGSYQLCDIRVTSESGYLTGQHQFQIRSRADNSIIQTGTISAKSATTGNWYNTTVSGGIATLILPYDTSNVQSQYAGNYYVYATSPGYEPNDYGTQIVVMPHTVSEIKSILLTPIGGVPTPGNVTLRIQVFSETGPGIPNAEIFIAGVLGEGSSVWDTYTASSTGYLTVSVPGNSTYDIVASGTGYYDSARRVQVFAEDPALIEIKLYLSGAPTVPPTTQPTGWVTPTPTQTTPPSQEDNLIGLSVKGLAKGFGIDYDTALLMFGLMIIFGAGGIVMNSVKGGAMEFIAGSIVGTFVAFALGLIPIWIFIIIVVVFGAYVLRVFVQGGQ